MYIPRTKLHRGAQSTLHLNVRRSFLAWWFGSGGRCCRTARRSDWEEREDRRKKDRVAARFGCAEGGLQALCMASAPCAKWSSRGTLVSIFDRNWSDRQVQRLTELEGREVAGGT